MPPRPTDAPYHLGLTPDRIVEEALALTERSHLFGWSLRDLAHRVGVTVSVITHHVGAKDRLLYRVVEKALADLVPPTDDLDWENWFRAMLHEIRRPLRRYPGTAKWVLLHGPAFSSIMPMIDTGIAALQRAGFGDKTGLAYATLFNNAVMTIAFADERLADQGDGSRDHELMMSTLRQTGTDRPGMATLDATLMTAFSTGSSTVAQAQDTYYTFVVDTTITGLRALLGR
ncbi:MAG TPA: TetR/AcrR family transcriptional regulator C-terminal domain-containing protein [Candidatus Stackebrandtia excrementipullorum]|nr:TetR/AcrR family transcriptional regulator C-terminal domain-containing protein [Candidatus Stackebrandtia excrementipullorum]